MPVRTDPPAFLVIGAQKCGTSWLHRHLSAHPDLWMPPGKELEFFSYAPHLEDPGLPAYQATFAPAEGRIAGEATASYFWTAADSPWCRQPEGFQSDIPGTVLRLLGPDLRLVVSLRDPVERALSAWAHYIAHGELDSSLPLREAARFGGIVDMGFYGRHLAAWRTHYPATHVHLLVMERDIVARPAESLAGLHRFLGVREWVPDSDALAAPVFPGLPWRDDQEGGRVLEWGDDHPPVRVTQEDLDWLRNLYREDTAHLASQAGDDVTTSWTGP